MQMDYQFDEIALQIGIAEVALFSGTATLDNDPGYGDGSSYGFIVSDITLEGSAPGNWRDKRSINIDAKHDDPFCRALFDKLSTAIQNSRVAQEQFSEYLNEELACA